MIWRYMYIDASVGVLAKGLASAFGVDEARVAVKEGGGMWPDWFQGREIWAEAWPACGEAQVMATLFVLRDPVEVERLDDRAVAQALADGMNCTVFLPDEADPHSDNYWRLCPHLAAERVALDPDGEDEEPVRVTVAGPAARPVLNDVPEVAA